MLKARIEKMKISIHALREEGDYFAPDSRPRCAYFYPRPPRGGRRHAQDHSYEKPLFLSTPSARRATRRQTVRERKTGISIHALREEGDAPSWGPGTLRTVFLSTPSARRATTCPPVCGILGVHFYPRPPRGGRRATPRATQIPNQFLSTPSARRATAALAPPVRAAVISIHALREEGDKSAKKPRCGLQNFYPRPPRGGRRGHPHAQGADRKFLSTPSARRATVSGSPRADSINISIHALREEGDLLRWYRGALRLHFYPRPPRGGRQLRVQCFFSEFYFYPRPPRGGRPSFR